MVATATTSTVSVAGVGLTLQIMSGEVTEIIGELLSGIRTAAEEVVLSAIRAFQIFR